MNSDGIVYSLLEKLLTLIHQENCRVTVLVSTKTVGKPGCMCRMYGEENLNSAYGLGYYGTKLTVLASDRIKRWVSVMAVLTLGVGNKDQFEGLS
jgi:hypothetical protein